MSCIGRSEYQFVQLDSFFEKNLFGVEFDYNPRVSNGQGLRIIKDLLNQTQFTNNIDPDLEEDNIITLVGHETNNIKSSFIALKQMKRTQDIIKIDWQSVVPFVKYLHHFSLPTGEDVILGQEFLGMALKVNGSGFNPISYQLGYANVPLEFLEFLIPDSQDYSFNSSVETSIMIQELVNELQIDLTYYNLTFLFQTNSIDLDSLFGLDKLAEHLVIVQFDKITFSIIIRKYTHFGTSGVETLAEISIGNVMNLIINEELPHNSNWSNAFDYKIQENFKDLIPINETFSWYQGSDITKRLQYFSDISFSLITAQNLGVLNGTQTVDDLQVVIDGQDRTTTELAQMDFPVKDGISVNHDERTLFSTQVKGRNFAIIEDDSSDEISLVPIEARVIALNQQSGFADNLLFRQETSLLKELIAECVKRFIEDPEISTLGTSEVINKGRLDLTSAQYIQDFQLVEWSGLHFKINLIQYAVKTAPFSTIKTKTSQITLIPTVSVLLGLLILEIVVKQGKGGKIKPKKP